MNQNTIRRGRIVLLAAVTLLVVLAGSAAAAKAITGEQGEQVKTPFSGLQYVTQTAIVANISHATVVVPCPAGTTALDGGVTSSSEPFTRVVSSAVDTDGSGWRVELWNQHPSQTLTAYGWAACIAVG